MEKQEKIRSKIRAFLPNAEENLVDLLVTEVVQELRDSPQTVRRRQRAQNMVVQQIIQREEMMQLFK